MISVSKLHLKKIHKCHDIIMKVRICGIFTISSRSLSGRNCERHLLLRNNISLELSWNIFTTSRPALGARTLPFNCCWRLHFPGVQLHHSHPHCTESKSVSAPPCVFMARSSIKHDDDVTFFTRYCIPIGLFIYQ
jgi:hypothetical protein